MKKYNIQNQNISNIVLSCARKVSQDVNQHYEIKKAKGSELQ